MPKAIVRGIVGVSLAGLAIILLIIAAFPARGWYSYDYSGEVKILDTTVEMDMELNYGLTDIESTTSMTVFGMSQKETIDGEPGQKEKNVGGLTLFLLVITLLSIIAFVVLGILAVMGKIKSLIVSIVGFVGVFFLLIALIYYPLAIPGATEKDAKEGMGMLDDGLGITMEEGFVDELVESGEPGWTYYMACFILAIIVAAVGLFIGIKVKPAAQAPVPHYPPQNPPARLHNLPPPRDEAYGDYDQRRDYPPPSY